MIPGDAHYTYTHRVKLNALGFRGPEVGEKQPNEYRILALGDSHIYGQGVPDESLLTHIVEAGLNETGAACRFRVVNLGVRAYSLNQEVALLEQLGVHLGPDHVLLFFYLNDFQRVNIEQVYSRYKDFDWYTFDLKAKPEGTRLYAWELIQILRKSAFVLWLNDRYKAWRFQGNMEQLILEGALNRDLQEKYSSVERDLDRAIMLSKQHGFTFTLVVMPFFGQLGHDYPEERYQSWLKRFAESRGIDFLDLLPGLRGWYQTSHRLPIIPFDGHYDADGHHAMGMQAAEYLRGRGICARAGQN
jgi:lysophospholipase L1-like esterase